MVAKFIAAKFIVAKFIDVKLGERSLPIQRPLALGWMSEDFYCWSLPSERVEAFQLAPDQELGPVFVWQELDENLAGLRWNSTERVVHSSSATGPDWRSNFGSYNQWLNRSSYRTHR